MAESEICFLHFKGSIASHAIVKWIAFFFQLNVDGSYRCDSASKKSEWNDARFTLFSLPNAGTKWYRKAERPRTAFLLPCEVVVQQVAAAANCAVSVTRRQHVLDTRLSGKSVYFHPFILHLAMCHLHCIDIVFTMRELWKCLIRNRYGLVPFAHLVDSWVCHRVWNVMIIILLTARGSHTKPKLGWIISGSFSIRFSCTLAKSGQMNLSAS